MNIIYYNNIFIAYYFNMLLRKKNFQVKQFNNNTLFFTV